MKLIPRLHTFLLCFLIAAAFSCAHKDTASGDNTAATTDAALNEITGHIEAGEWETARVKAENTYASARDGMTPLQAAKLAADIGAGDKFRAILRICPAHCRPARFRIGQRQIHRFQLFQNHRRGDNGTGSIRQLQVYHLRETENRGGQHNHLQLTAPNRATASANYFSRP